MFGLLSVTLALDSLLLGTGLFALCVGFAFESVWTRDRRIGVLSIVCATAFVSIVWGLVSPATIATYTLLAAQIVGVVFFFFFWRHWFRSLSPSTP